MKKIFTFVLLALPVFSYAQWIDVSALYGAGPYKISAGIKNGSSGSFNVSASIVKLSFLDAGIQYSSINTVTLCKATSPGVFADLVFRDEAHKNIFLAGGQINYTTFGNIKTGGYYLKDGTRDTVSTTLDKAISYGVRLGYKRQIIEHLYVYALISPTYSVSTIHYTGVGTNNCALLYLPFMIGVSARF